jgi:hypothetical protein
MANSKSTTIKAIYTTLRDFVRSSWRANDFLWGHLDGAARLVDLLIAPSRLRRSPVRYDTLAAIPNLRLPLPKRRRGDLIEGTAMANFPALDLAVGLSFVYFLLSVLATKVTETISRFLKQCMHQGLADRPPHAARSTTAGGMPWAAQPRPRDGRRRHGPPDGRRGHQQSREAPPSPSERRQRRANCTRVAHAADSKGRLGLNIRLRADAENTS